MGCTGEGFERRLLATVRWTVATAVAFPQKSKSLSLRQKRSNFCLPKVTSFFIQAAGLVYHHDAVVYIISPFGAVSHHASACILLRLDEMQHCVLMICNSCGIDDIQGFALIALQNYDIIILDKLEFDGGKICLKR